ncbi:MAG: hypothetical protein PHU25_10400 [Deltaproteobacteria bacterium]|nr:hypothetical protein [Deltaproteobacteria bacterium]
MGRFAATASSLVFLALACGCGNGVVDVITGSDAGRSTDSDSETGTGSDADSGLEPDLVVATVVVPPVFDAVPARIAAAFLHEPDPRTKPDALGAQYDEPAIGAGQPYDLVSTQAGLTGPHYLRVILFVEGGGTGEPIPGVDFVGIAQKPVFLGPGTGTVKAGTIHLHLTP